MHASLASFRFYFFFEKARSNYYYYDNMPPKKRSQAKNQPKLNQFIEKQENSELGSVDREAKINSIMEKLAKVRL